ncbi:hypothetical protein U1Q18_003408 [Sarracenia purpurea var. burkii]
MPRQAAEPRGAAAKGKPARRQPHAHHALNAAQKKTTANQNKGQNATEEQAENSPREGLIQRQLSETHNSPREGQLGGPNNPKAAGNYWGATTTPTEGPTIHQPAAMS